jgi:NADH-quinone oxidoreductase subunit D
LRTLDADEAAHGFAELTQIEAVVQAFQDDLEDRPKLDAHLEGVGVLTAGDVTTFSLSGPAARACGVADDVRSHDPSIAAAGLPFAVRTAQSGCARARMRVRLAECLVSAAMVRASLALAAAAPPESRRTLAPLTSGCITAALEAPHGEVTVTVASDGQKLSRVRIKTASFNLVWSLSRALVGDRVEDLVTAVSSFGIVGTEVDR